MYLQNTRSLNQKELVGLFKAISDTQAMGKENADIAMRECLKCILRNQLDKTFAEELACCRNFVDSCLCRQFLSLRKAGVKPQTWLDSNWSLARLLMEEADLQAVKHSAGNWKAVATHVARLTASSSLGQALFGYAEQLVSSAIFEDKVEKDVADLLTADVTADKVRDVRVACEAYTGDLKRIASLKGLKRHVAINFLQQSVTVTIMDFSLEVHLRLSAALKGLAIQQGQLQRLPYEDWLLPAALEPKIRIQEELLQDAAACRKLAVEMLQSESVNSLQDMAKILEKNSQALCSLDSSFKLELAFLSTSADDLLKATVTRKLLETLPSESRRRSLTQSLAAVQDLSQTQMLKMSPPALRTLAQSVEEILANMLRGAGPEASLAKSSDFYAKVMHHLGFFVWEGEGAGVTYAAPALKKKFHECQKKLQADPKSVSLGDLEIFQTYKFLLSSDDAEQLGKSVKQCLSAASTIAPAAKLPAKKPKDLDSKKSSSVAVMSYFG